MLCCIAEKRPAGCAGVQRGGPGGAVHTGYRGHRLPRLPSHRSVHHPRHPGERAGAERYLWQHWLRQDSTHAPQVYGAGEFMLHKYTVPKKSHSRNCQNVPCDVIDSVGKASFLKVKQIKINKENLKLKLLQFWESSLTFNLDINLIVKLYLYVFLNT